MTTVFAFQFSDHEYFTNKCMSLGIFHLDQSNYVCSWKQKDFNTFQLSLYRDSLQTKLAIASNIQCKMSKSYRSQQKCWTHPFKIMILFAWSWSKYELFRAEVNNKTFVQPCWFPLYTFDVPVTESPTAVAVQNYTQLDDHNQLSH